MDIQTLVEQYLNGELNLEQRADFEKKVRTDSALAKELSLQQDMQNYLLNKDKKEAFRNKLQEVGDDFFEEKSGHNKSKTKIIKSINNYRWLAIAAATAAAVVVAFYLFSPTPDLYKQFAQHQPIQLTQKGSADDRLLSAIELHFNQQEYEEALDIIDQLPSTESSTLETQLIKSICLIETDQIEEARKILEPIATGESAFKTEAQWHLAMSFLKAEQLEEAKGNLERIEQSDAYWFNKAKEVLKVLE